MFAWTQSYFLFHPFEHASSFPNLRLHLRWHMTVCNWVQGGGWRQGGADAGERRAASSCQ